MTLSKALYIDGRMVGGQGSVEVINPATEKVVGAVARGTEAEAEAALASAQKAFPVWSSMSIEERTGWMEKLRQAVIAHEDHLRECVHLEMGKTWSDTGEDFDGLVHSLKYYAEEIRRLRPEQWEDASGSHTHRLLKQPVGVAVAFLAWNFPLLNFAYKLGPAMASGCPIVIKPSLKSPLSACALGELCAEIGLPAGAVNIVCGDDQVVGDALSASTIPALVTLIGSTATGLHVVKNAATSIKRFSMELGGNAPALVFADADLDLAADIVCGVKFGNAGQICVTPNRVYVERSVLDVFTQKVVERAQAVKVGFDRHEDVDMGPVIDAAAWHRINNLVKGAVEDGADLLCGGGRPMALHDGHFYAPTVLGRVNEDMRVCREEVFGPVVSLLSFEDEANVLEAANDTDAGLTAYVFTGDLNKAERCADALRFGEIQINGIKYGMDLPHVGIKQSGVGVDGSHLALDDYLVPKRVSRGL